MPEFTPEMYASEKLRRYYGLRLFVSPDRAREHLRMLKGAPYYMSNLRIAELAGICESNLAQIYKGQRGKGRGHQPVGEIHRDTEAAILGVTPEVNPPARGGGQVPPIGTRRRLQALVAKGFSMKFLSGGMGWGVDPQPVHRLVHGKSGTTYVQHSTYMKACALYEKYSDADPAELGIPQPMIKRSKTVAKKNGFAPPTAWDDDLIDDPAAFPEWTGACGTEEGYRIHLRERIDMCDACKYAVRGDESAKMEFSAWKFRELVEKRGLSYAKLGPMLGVTEDTARRWAQGSNKPQTRHYETILHVLNAEPRDVFELPEQVDYIVEADFNRHKFRLAMEEHGVGAHALSKATGVSHTSIHNWTAGNKIPQAPNVRKVAEYFGVDWKVFYDA